MRLVSRTFLLTISIFLIAVQFAKPVLAPLPPNAFHDEWNGNVCVQTTSGSCGVASAATILRQLGISATEQELGLECYTYQSGTENWYLARALRRRGLQVHYRTEHGFPPDLHPPAIAGLAWGHFVSILAKTQNGYLMADPIGGGRKECTAEDLKDYRFSGFFMEISKGGS